MHLSNLDLTRKILSDLISGLLPEEIAQSNGVSIENVIALQAQAIQFVGSLPERKKRSGGSRHKLTTEDRRRGQQRGEETRKRLHAESFDRVVALIEGKERVGRIAAVAYYLAKGSSKECALTIITPTVAKLFWVSLRVFGVPADAICFRWRNADPNSLPDEWRSIAIPVAFAASGRNNSMHLRVAPFVLSDGTKVSSRALGRALLQLGKSVIEQYTGQQS